MYKVVVNKSFGGFGLSDLAQERLEELIGDVKIDRIKRHDPRLVQVVEELGEQSNDDISDLKIVEIDHPLYTVRDYDGMESIILENRFKWCNAEETV